MTAVGAVLAATATASSSRAALTFNVEAGGWPNTAHRDAAVAAMQSVVNRYNAYGDFGNYNVYAYYNAGIPTAQANYLGSIGFGGTYPNERVSMHELGHYLGSGTAGTPWDGFRGETLVDQFDGLEASLNGDSQHFWPYGLNYDNEGSEINKQRQVALIYAQRADMGIGSGAKPSSATVATLTASDATGESGFNYANTWSNTHFAQAGTSYFTGNFTLRTPASNNSFTFAGDALTVNNTNGVAGGLLYKGTGTTGVVSFRNLNLNGGYVRHASAAGDVFRLAGKIAVSSSTTIDAAQGGINISADIAGSGSITKAGAFPLTLTGSATYAGDTTINAGTLRLAPVAPVANYTFDSVNGSTVVNNGTGGAGMNGSLANGAAIVANGQSGNAVSLSGGASVNISNPITDLGANTNWSVSAWVKTTTPGGSLLTKGDGGWSNGNTIFYLGDGSAGGSGSIPSSVRYGGGFLQGSTSARPVADGTWHQVTYVNSVGNYAIYVDGVAQPLSAGNAGFGNVDIGSIVRLGASTNTFAGDGTLNYNGLLDNVQFYGHALTGPQVTALYQGGGAFGSLPVSTNVTIGSGATLDLNGTVQQIGSLSGAAGSAVALGGGRLIVTSSANTQFAGSISGAGGSLVKHGVGTLTLNGANSYTGSTTISGGTLRLDAVANASVAGGAVANYTFDNVTGTTVVNSGLGGVPMNGLLANGATIVAGGHTGKAVSLAGGASVNIANPITDLSNTNDWTVSAWLKTTTPGGSILTKGNGSGWANGYTIFYLGDGADGGSGGIPSGVRYAGGFFQGSTSAASVTDGVWHQVTYVNNSGTYAIYVDGVAQPLSGGGFGNADVGSIIRLGVSTNTIAGDGTLNYNGLLDDVQFYGRALSPDQIAALYGGLNLGSLPVTTDVSIASGATLDVNGLVQEIATLNGPSGSAVLLGSGRLILNSSASSQFAGAISGDGGSLLKKGTGTLTLSGPNSYGGDTILQAGTLVIASAAQAPILDVDASGADIQGGKLVFDYTGGNTPAAQVLAILDAGYDQAVRFSSGGLRDTALPASQLLGWSDDSTAHTVTILATRPGDANLDLNVEFTDLLALAQNYDAAGTGKVWSQGDFNYDGVVSFIDLLALAQNYAQPASFEADWALALSLVPEPTSAVAVPLLAVVVRRRREVAV